MLNGPTDNVRTMVNEINKVGLRCIKEHFDKHYPTFNFRRNLAIVRSVAKIGYAEKGGKFSISRQRAWQILKRFYACALECEKARGYAQGER